MSFNHLIRYTFTPLREGVFFFVTDQGCYYTIEISNDHHKFDDNELLRNAGQSFEIGFGRICDDEKPLYDEIASATILFILGTNIVSKGDTCTYFFVCDTTDGNGKLRARLFNLWYAKLKLKITQLEKHNFIIPVVDTNRYDVSLIIFRNHIYHDEYLREFKTYIKNEFAKW